jgi:pilus assembly protein Flp/PilA
MIRSFFAKEEGQGLVEYALILVLIAIVVIGILTLLGGKVSQVFSSINSGLSLAFLAQQQIPGRAWLARVLF